jgi:prepilin-type N-terminal cleavage/methylation domain-containing protein
MRKLLKSQAGFTLLELVVVIVAVAILVTIIIFLLNMK